MLKTNKQNQNQKANKNNKKPLDLLCNKNEVGELRFYIQRLFLPKCSLWWPVLRGMTALWRRSQVTGHTTAHKAHVSSVPRHHPQVNHWVFVCHAGEGVL